MSVDPFKNATNVVNVKKIALIVLFKKDEKYVMLKTSLYSFSNLSFLFVYFTSQATLLHSSVGVADNDTPTSYISEWDAIF